MYNWQHDVKERKVLLHNDKAAQCPVCGEFEKRMHYLTCRHIEMVQQRTHLLHLLEKQLGAAGTYPGITTVIQYILEVGYTQEWMTTINTHQSLEASLLKTFNHKRI